MKKRYKNILEENPKLGESLGYGIYKIRVKNSNKN